MKRTITVLVPLILCITQIQGSVQEKCCKQDYQLVHQGSTFTCVYNSNKRLQSNFKIHDFLNKNVSGNCIEIYSENKIATFTFDNSIKKVSKDKTLEVKHNPKCCPLGLEYNDLIHSCDETVEANRTDIFTENSFIEIGLPHCKIISDHIFDSIDEVNIDNVGIEFKNTSRRVSNEKYCVDSTLSGKFVARICEDDFEICENITCIHKCCPDGKSFINGSNCLDTFKYGVDLNFTSRIEDPSAPFAIIYGMPEKMFPLEEAIYNFYLYKAGIFSTYMNKSAAYINHSVSEESYCIEHTYMDGIWDNYFLFGKSIIPPLEIKFSVSRWAKMLSCFSLLLTISVYLILPRMRNLFGKILLSYSIATFLFFFFLCISQFYYNEVNDFTCRCLGYISLLASIWSFTWLHIMCIDIWLSFGTTRTLAGPLQKNEFKRFLQYSLYGWGFPIFWILLIYLCSTTTIVPEEIRPYVGENKCYMENYDSKPGNFGYPVFVTLPLLIQQVINTVLFVKTVVYCLKIKDEIERMNDARRKSDLNAGRERMGLIMKLAVIMGVSFLFETVSSLYNFQNTTVTTYIEVVWDTVNCLQGVFIFIIFICKKKVYDKLCEKIPVLKSRKSSLSSSATTQVSMHQISGNKRDKTP